MYVYKFSVSKYFHFIPKVYMTFCIFFAFMQQMEFIYIDLLLLLLYSFKLKLISIFICSLKRLTIELS